MNNEIILKKIIELEKPIDIEKFIQLCLYSKFGYYKKAKIIGREGDYVTAPEISQLFGEIICFFVISTWREKINKSFNLIELGPGKGTMLIDFLNIAKNFKEFYKSFNIFLIEKNPNFIKDQYKNILKYDKNLENIVWKKKFQIPTNKPVIIYANEFFDCLPVRQFLKKNNDWHEKKIIYKKKEDSLCYINSKVKDKKTITELDQYKNTSLEISKKRYDYFKNICNHINLVGGLAIVIDYGYFNKPNHFTLQSTYNNKKSNVLDNLGCQDITSLVDFGELSKIAISNNLKVDILCSQSEFLLEYGILERAKQITKNSTKNQKKEICEGINRLIDSNKMGSIFKVLVISK